MADLSAQAVGISRFKKERFLLSLSEDDFRDRVVRPLLLRRGFRDGRDLCGPTEKGKDAVFVIENALGLKEVWVLQTKKGKLNLARKANQSLIEAATQLRTALTTKVLFAGTKERRLPDKAILCASGKINEAAREHVVAELDDPRITFLDPDDLIPSIDEHLPELWFDIDAAVRPYLRAVKRLVESVNDDLLPSFGEGKALGAATNSMFVTLYVNRTEIKVKRRKGLVEREPEIIELPIQSIISRRERLILITGPAGFGKSTALRRLAYVLVEKNLASSGAEQNEVRIPVLLKAASVAASDGSLLQLSTDETMRLADSTKPAFTAEDLSSGRVVILIDALDEVASDDDRSRVLQKATDFNIDYPQCQIIVTSRDYSFVTILAELAPFSRFSLTPIGLPQAEQLLKKIERTRQLPVEASREIMRRLQQVHGFELNPMLVTVFAATSDYSRKDVPANITELFKKFTEVMLGRWSAVKGLGQQFHGPLKDFLLRQIAYEMHRRKVTAISLSELESLLTAELAARGHEAEIDALIEEMLYQSGLFRIIDDQVEFRHLLLQEFFAGRGIPSLDVLQTVVSDDWWQRAIVFYFGEHPADIRGIEAARDAVQPRTDQEKYRAAITLGLALQACYLVEVKDKADAFTWVIEILARSRHGFVQDAVESGVPDLLGFLYHYLFGRDAVACSLPEEVREQARLQLERVAVDPAEQDEFEFWQLIARIGTAVDASIERRVKRFDPADEKLLFAVWLSLRFVEDLRVAPKAEKEIAARAASRLFDRVKGVGDEFSKQYKSVLLEVRKGQVTEGTPIDDWFEGAKSDKTN